MITEMEVKEISQKLGVPLAHVEKDYVMGWILHAIYSHPKLKNKLVLKGGNCLRKVYFKDTRFSDDLDFTMRENIPSQVFQSYLNEICVNLKKSIGIEFESDKTIVKEKDIFDKSFTVLDGRVYFKGFAGDSSVTMRIKFDVSEYEKIVLPLQWHPLIHNFSDNKDCEINIYCYSIEEVLAEKLRSWIQRTRSRDLFDVAKIVKSKAVPLTKTRVLTTFLQKTIFKNIPVAGKDELLYEKKFAIVEKSWISTIVCPKTTIIVFRDAIKLFKDFINTLFSKETFDAIKLSFGSPRDYFYNIRSGVREAIIQAGKERKLIRMRYSGKERDIEPYSFRYRGNEYFYGFDRTRGNTIKSFFLSKIESISILPNHYTPRWVVEF